MNTVDKGVLVVVLEFCISVIVLLGGGFVLMHHPDQTTTTVVTTAIGAVIPFWFMRRQTDSTSNQNTQIQQTVQDAVQKGVQQGIQQAVPPASNSVQTLVSDPTQLPENQVTRK